MKRIESAVNDVLGVLFVAPFVLACFVLLSGCGYLSASGSSDPASRIVKENAARTRKFHELNDKVSAAQAVLQDWLNGEVRKCDAEGNLHPPAKGMKMQLHFTQATADLACDAMPDPAAAAQPKPPAPTIAPPPAPVEKK